MDNGTEPSLPLDLSKQSGVIAGQKIGYARVSSKAQVARCLNIGRTTLYKYLGEKHDPEK